MAEIVAFMATVTAPPVPGTSAVQLLPLLLVVPLIAFWAWMLREMLNNHNLAETARNVWLIAFIFLNVFAAVFYYVYEYRNKR